MNKINRNKILLFSFLFILFLNIGAIYTSADNTIPVNVRIGLFFKDPSYGMDCARTYVLFNSAMGLQVGFSRDNIFTSVYEETTSGNITIRKDSYLVLKNNNEFAEYDPAVQPLPEGLKIGPFHVKINSDFIDFASARDYALIIAQAGIPAYVAYNDIWQVWTGFYTTRQEAEQDITANIAPRVGNVAFTVITPIQGGIVVMSPGNTAVAFFASVNSFLEVRPKIPDTAGILKINDVPYRGYFEIRRIAVSDMTVINVLSVDEYLYGVIPCEIESYSHPEALKAQAVAARTYSLSNIGKHGTTGFDMCASTSCQLYKGFSIEQTSTNKAVDDTRGQILSYNGSIAEVYYFSSSGGMTEDSVNVWGSARPYLLSVSDEYESGNSWNYKWSVKYTAAKIKEVFAARKIDIGDILSINPVKYSAAGRVTELNIKGTKGERVYTNWNCKTVLGSLNSQMYTIATDADIRVSASGKSLIIQLAGKISAVAGGNRTIRTAPGNITVLGAGGIRKIYQTVPTYYLFDGKGWGHAVGLSQEGAKGMANSGVTYDKILAHYFPGTTIG